MTDKRFRMIDKRFQIFSSVIEDTQGIIPIILCNNDKQKQKFYDGLNGLNDENEQLKMENDSLKLLVQNWEALDEEKDEQLDKQNQALKKLKKDNEQLKQKNTMLNKDLRYITDRKNYLESEWDKFYELVDKKIKKLEDKYEFGRTKYGACPMHNIMFGINVLKELLRELEE